jgi:regulator of protease activity HflC (stomatin/prohibitin superfamily)
MAGNSEGKRKKLPWTGILILLLAVMILIPVATTSFYSVNPDETALVFRYGKLISVQTFGLHVKAPFGIDRTAKIITGTEQLVSVPLELKEYGLLPYLANEGLPVYVRMNIIYKISDPLAWFRFSGNQQYIMYVYMQDKLVKLIAGSGAETAALADQGKEKYSGIARQLLVLLESDDTLKSWGVDIVRTELLKLDLPVRDKSLIANDDNIIGFTIGTLLANIKQEYKRAYAAQELNENAMARIKEDGYPWE